MPVYLKAPSYDPCGPDGQGWNRMAILGTCFDECALRPKTEMAFWLVAKDTTRAMYGHYGPCERNGQCGECPWNADGDWPFAAREVLVRVDNDGAPWLMNKKEKGWGEYGEPTTWERVYRLNGEVTRYADEYGSGYLFTKTT